MEFVTFEIAKKLKEKGLPQVKKGTIAMYNEEGEWFSLASNLDDYEYAFEDFDDKDCVCPTISQVLNWLRKEKKLHIQIFFTCPPNKWEYITVKMTNNELRGMRATFTSYEQAAVAGISYVLDNLI